MLNKRIRTLVEKGTNLSFAKTYQFVDSEIVKGMISKESYGYNTFEANRIGEIQETTKAEDWFWISGSDNIADWITRGCAPIKLSKDSTWQNGPEFLKHTEDRWPIKANANTLSINLSKEKIEFNGTVTTPTINWIIILVLV